MAANWRLEVKGLIKDFGGLRAVDRLSFGVGPGEIVGLIGPNGSGKSTTINCIAGCIKPSAGQIVCKGQPIEGLSPWQVSLKGVARTFQQSQLFSDQSVLESMVTAHHSHEKTGFVDSIFRRSLVKSERDASEVKARELLRWAGVPDEMLYQQANTLSHGWQRIVAISMAMATKPDILMLDEPAAGLSTEKGAELIDLINELRRQGLSILVVDHHMWLITRVCDRIVVIDHGVKIADGKPQDVVKNEAVIQAYLGETRQTSRSTAAASTSEAMSLAPILDIQNLVVSYGAVVALKGVDVKVRKGELLAVIGSNGAGKSTLLRAISGLVNYRSGSIVFEGALLDGLSPHKRVQMGIVQVPPGKEVFRDMTVLENLELGGYLCKDKTEFRRRLDRAYATFPILHARKGQLAGTLSGGEQQMLCIGRGLMADPKVLMMDEPSQGLAPRLVAELSETICKIRDELSVTMVLVEQNARMALEIADRGCVLQLGELFLEGKPSKLMEDEQIRQAYLGV